MNYTGYWEIFPNAKLSTTTKPNWLHRKMFLWCFDIKWVKATEVIEWMWRLDKLEEK